MYFLKVAKHPDPDASLTPPLKQIFDGSHTTEAFQNGGEAATREYLIHRGRLKPDERVLDIGSGIGKIARPLTVYLDAKGSYDGVEIVKDGVEWCDTHYERFPNFRFHHADIYSKHYNASGTTHDHEYRFPFDDLSFDFIILRSVFTHMLKEGVENYIREIGRLLCKGGRCFVTGFFLNPDSIRRTENGVGEWVFPHRRGSIRLLDDAVPERGVAHDEAHLRAQFAEQGLDLADATYGDWCGRGVTLPTIQDAWILVKS
ncbi:class I SAM-dependent methyltransferase [Roseibacterium beibuensis]|uniref:Class I SAM-dependent methyltransferase n=1 Tax=[Roseibacterium] beibuensis TaxID=1193142 RepID=A0ABP9LB74_9RHOB|nr:class I SAM-dependent methyltransferase [Roseibacterium beibuensis]MCS6624161.1 class I SAM-dependent methyltransferase [Roseibacterium beibuensis]